jgi:hypothetical protein
MVIKYSRMLIYYVNILISLIILSSVLLINNLNGVKSLNKRGDVYFKYRSSYIKNEKYSDAQYYMSVEKDGKLFDIEITKEFYSDIKDSKVGTTVVNHNDKELYYHSGKYIIYKLGIMLLVFGVITGLVPIHFLVKNYVNKYPRDTRTKFAVFITTIILISIDIIVISMYI